MKYAGIQYNDVTNGEGVNVSFFAQGCPHRCVNCHNPQTWDFNGGKEADEFEIIDDILLHLNANGVQRNFSVLGGEPLCEQNILFISKLICSVRLQFKNIKIFLWTGYELNSIKQKYLNSPNHLQALSNIFGAVDVIVDGPYIDELRDISLHLRGSSNQRILKRGIDF